jgi:hypothetical protein
VSGVLGLLGIGALALGLEACEARDPGRFGRYAIVAHVDGEAQYFDLVRDGRTAYTLAGSLDTLCEPPIVASFDVDGDGASDLYVRNCRGHGYLALRAGALEYVDQGDGPEPDGWWARQVLAGGTRLIVHGVAWIVAALIALAIAGATLRPGAMAPPSFPSKRSSRRASSVVKHTE